MPLAGDFVPVFTSGYRVHTSQMQILSRRTGVAQRGHRDGVGPTPAPSDAETTTPMPAVTDGAAFDPSVPAARDRARAIPEAAVARLAGYLRGLFGMQE